MCTNINKLMYPKPLENKSREMFSGTRISGSQQQDDVRQRVVFGREAQLLLEPLEESAVHVLHVVQHLDLLRRHLLPILEIIKMLSSWWSTLAGLPDGIFCIRKIQITVYF
jgi:hypothetical protein